MFVLLKMQHKFIANTYLPTFLHNPKYVASGTNHCILLMRVHSRLQIRRYWTLLRYILQFMLVWRTNIWFHYCEDWLHLDKPKKLYVYFSIATMNEWMIIIQYICILYRCYLFKIVPRPKLKTLWQHSKIAAGTSASCNKYPWLTCICLLPVLFGWEVGRFWVRCSNLFIHCARVCFITFNKPTSDEQKPI